MKKENLLKSFFGGIIVLMLLIVPGIIGGTAQTHYYKTGVVMSRVDDRIMIRDNKDNNWIWISSDSTLTVGDIVKMWMFTNYTDDTIYDDSIESIKILKKSALR
jgi:hypothetical protein